jgi:hypothetical protein
MDFSVNIFSGIRAFVKEIMIFLTDALILLSNLNILRKDANLRYLINLMKIFHFEVIFLILLQPKKSLLGLSVVEQNYGSVYVLY